MRTNPMLRLVALGVTMTTGGLLLQPAAALAAQPQGDVIVRQEAGLTVTIPDPRGKVKTKPEAITPLAGYYLTPHKEKTITAPGGSSGKIISHGNTNYVPYWVPLLGYTKVDFYNTESYAFWGGTSPYNCTSVKHTDVWDVDYSAISWSFGGTVTPNVNYGNGRIGLENTVPDTYRVSHHGDHVFLSVTAGDIFVVKYEAHGAYQFGGDFYFTDAYSLVNI